MQQSGMQLAKNYEWMELDERKAKGRHAYVPVDTFGFRVREMFQPLPGTPYYATDEERLQPPLSQTRTPEWIARAKERGTSLREARQSAAPTRRRSTRSPRAASAVTRRCTSAASTASSSRRAAGSNRSGRWGARPLPSRRRTKSKRDASGRR